MIGRDYNFSLSPNGGEGWGEGEFWLVFAKIAKIASRTASVFLHDLIIPKSKDPVTHPI